MRAGTDGESETHILASNDFEVCQRGDVNFFLLRYENHVGDIIAIRMWHNNSGRHPSWYSAYPSAALARNLNTRCTN